MRHIQTHIKDTQLESKALTDDLSESCRLQRSSTYERASTFLQKVSKPIFSTMLHTSH